MANSRIKAADKIVRKLKKGASIARGTYLKGPKHTQGGIKVINKSTGETLEVEGGEAVITAPALSDNKLHDFEGRKMTKRQILSAINQDAGGVAFAEGGRIKKKLKVKYCNKQYKYGGQMMHAKDIVSDCGCKHGGNKMESGGKVEKQKGERYVSGKNILLSYGSGTYGPGKAIDFFEDTETNRMIVGEMIKLAFFTKKERDDFYNGNAAEKKGLESRYNARVANIWEKQKRLIYFFNDFFNVYFTSLGTVVISDNSDMEYVERNRLSPSRNEKIIYKGEIESVNDFGILFRIKGKITKMAAGGAIETIEYAVRYEVEKEDGADNQDKYFTDIDKAIAFAKEKYADISYEKKINGERVEYGYVNIDAKSLVPDWKKKMEDGGQVSDRKTIPIPDSIRNSDEPTNSGYYQHYKHGGRLKRYPDLSNDLPPVINEKGAVLDDTPAALPKASTRHIREIELKLTDRKDMPAKTFTNSHDIYDYLYSIWDKDSLNIQESFYVLYLNRANKLIGYQELSRGGITGTVADPELIVATASKALARGVILAHNHPSGNLRPSPADENITKKISLALKYIDASLVDHIIVTPTQGSYYSFVDEGMITYAKGGAIKGDMTASQFAANLQKLRKFMPSFQVDALMQIYRGEEKEYAIEIMQRLLHTFDTMPKTYQTEKQEMNDKIIYLHYFYGGMDWYIVEKDSEPVQYQAFGYANLDDSENAEWGYISIVEIMQTNRVELDFNWTPITFGQLKGKWEPEEEPTQVKKKATKGRFQYGQDFNVPENYAAKILELLSAKGFRIVQESGSSVTLEKNDHYFYVNDNGGEFNLGEINDNGGVGQHISNIAYTGSHPKEWIATPEKLATQIEEDFNEHYRGNNNEKSETIDGIDKVTYILNVLQKFKNKSQTAYLTAKDQQRYKKNEDNNYHSENLLLLANATGGVDLIEAAEILLAEQDKAGYLTSELKSLANRISDIIKVVKEGEEPAQSTTQNPLAGGRGATINNEIRALVKQKGDDRSKYSAQEIALLKLYEGAGSEKKTSTDARILDQFFTPMDIVARMWGLAFKHGFSFSGGKAVLEPSVGSGRFLAFIPTDMPVMVRAYDVDATCVAICKILYPHVHTLHESFEKTFFQGRRHIGLAGVDVKFDLVIGNPPYREYVSEYAPLGEKAATGASTFEMYFIARGVDVLEKGGLLVFIIPNTFLSNDNKYNDFKEKLAKKADLIDAYRLPNGVFGNTDVGTDIIVLRKK